MFKKTLAFAALATASLFANAQSTPVGLWKTIDDESGKEKSLVRIQEANGQLTGTIEKFLDPATKPDVTCNECSDERKGKPILGMQILRGLKPTSDKARWEGGEILDPNKGKIYKSRITLIDGGKKLEMRGYIGTPLLGRTQTWLRVE
jgi:uncharacterized protein (DUF2147 family)